MSITAEDKARIMKEFATKEGDTGSPEVQVAILTSRTISSFGDPGSTWRSWRETTSEWAELVWDFPMTVDRLIA